MKPVVDIWLKARVNVAVIKFTIEDKEDGI
jgi:hypothetical protein